MSKLTPVQVRAILRRHQLWLQHGGRGKQALFEDCDLPKFCFKGKDLRMVRFQNVRGIETDFTEANLENAVFLDSDFSNSVFNGANLKKAIIYDSNFRSANFARTNLQAANVSATRFAVSRFDSCDMTELLGGSGNDFSDSILHQVTGQEATFVSSSFCRAVIHFCDFTQAAFRSVDFTDAQFRKLKFRDANFSGSNFAQSYGVKFSQCSWSGFGQSARMILAIKDRRRITFHCGCFSGDEKELRCFIDENEENFRASRLQALEFLLQTIK